MILAYDLFGGDVSPKQEQREAKMRDLETRIRKAFGLTPAGSNFHIVVQAYYDALASREDLTIAYDAALAAYCMNNDASPADNATRTMVGVLIADAGIQRDQAYLS